MTPIQISNINIGGIADSDYMGSPNSLSEIVGLDLHSEPGVVKALQKMTAMSGTNFPNEFCTTVVNCSNGRIYWFSSQTGKVWEDNSGTWSLKFTVAPKNGQAKILGAAQFEGYIYFSTQNFLHRIKVTDASGTWTAGTTVDVNWADLSLDQELSRKASVGLKFDGVDDKLTIASSTLNHTDSITFGGWFLAEDDTTDVKKFTIWGTNDVASSLQIELGGDTAASPNRNRVAVYSGSTLVAQTDSNVFEAGVWHYLTYTRSGSGAGNHRIYINGIERALLTDVSTSFASTTVARYIGIKSAGNINGFKGLLADIKIQTTVLTAAQVLSTFEQKSWDVTNMLAYYPLNYTTRDFTGSNHGTIGGNPSFYYITDFEIPYKTLLANSLLELETDKSFFKSNSETITYVKFWVVDKGTGSVTITLHNSANSSVGSVTTTNGNLVTGWNYAVLNASNLVYGGVYHLHIFGSTTDILLRSSNYNDISDAQASLLSDGDLEFHPMLIQNLVLFIGDRNYIHQVDKNRVDGTHIFSSRALDIPSPLRVKCLGKFVTDLLVGTIVDSRISKTVIYRWNTWSQSWNVSDEIPEEGINAFIDLDNHIMVSAGLQGSLYSYDGNNLDLMRSVKGNYADGGKVAVNPNATANLRGIGLFGLSNVDLNPTKQGIYAFGSKNVNYPQILTLDYPMSKRTGSDFVFDNLEIGALVVVGNVLYASWRHNSTATVGIDKLDYSSKLDGAYFITRFMDLSKIRLNNYRQFIMKYITLGALSDIGMYYSNDMGLSFVDLNPKVDSIKRQVRAEKTIQTSQIQWKVKLICNGNETPKITEGVILAD